MRLSLGDCAAEENEEPNTDEDRRKDDIVPPVQGFCDRPSGGDPFGREDHDRGQSKENDAVSKNSIPTDRHKYRYKNANIVATIGEGHDDHRPHRYALVTFVCIVIVFVAIAPRLPGGP